MHIVRLFVSELFNECKKMWPTIYGDSPINLQIPIQLLYINNTALLGLFKEVRLWKKEGKKLLINVCFWSLTTSDQWSAVNNKWLCSLQITDVKPSLEITLVASKYKSHKVWYLGIYFHYVHFKYPEVYTNYVHYTTGTNYTPYKLYTIQTIHHINYTPYKLHHINYTPYKLYTIQTIHHTNYTSYKLYTIQTIHHINYTPYKLYTIQTIHHTNYTPYKLYII